MRIIFLVVCILFAATSAHAQQNSYYFSLNGRVTATNPRVVAGPYGCTSRLLDLDTNQLVCQGNPEDVWFLRIADYCGLTDPEYGYNLGRGRCVNGIVGVGQECGRNPHTCQYYVIVDINQPMVYRGVRVTDISRLGRDLWIFKPEDSSYGRYTCWFMRQDAHYPERTSC